MTKLLKYFNLDYGNIILSVEKENPNRCNGNGCNGNTHFVWIFFLRRYFACGMRGCVEVFNLQFVFFFFLHVVKSVITCHSLCVPECSFLSLHIVVFTICKMHCTYSQLISRWSQVTSGYFQLSSVYAYTFQWKYKEISCDENQRLMENSCLSLIFLINTHAYELNKYRFCLFLVRLHCP